MSITGATTLTAIGQTEQLTAKNTSGTVVTGGVTWKSANTTVVTVSAAGLVTATGLGATLITAIYQSATAIQPIAVGPQGTTPIAACGTLSAPGPYVLAIDLSPVQPNSTCVTINGTSGLQLDCQGHSIWSLVLNGVSNGTVTNCAAQSLTGTGLSNVTIVRSAILTLSFTGATSCIVTNSTFSPVVGTRPDAGVFLTAGSNNQILNNAITGGYDGSAAKVGIDDGVLLENETGDVIQGNTITNFYDTALESIGGVATTTIANNTMTNLGMAGIGTYWCTNWSNNVIRGNAVSRSPTLLYVVYDTGGPRGSTPPAGFTGNQVLGNSFSTPTGGYQSLPAASPRMFVFFPSGSPVASNVLQGNNFGSNDGPALTPLSGFIDGGGNICGPLNPAISNFVCTGGGSAGFRRSRESSSSATVGRNA
ncbi:MAG TPA: Ig-like domain-containing protein, partial [Vicinamibacterales bacterium]